MISAIVLAAGESRRMGRQKLLLPFGNGTVITSVINTAFKGGISELTVVLGPNGDAILNEIQDLPVRVSRNTNSNQGMFSSIQCGISSLPLEAKACLLMLGDQPAFHFGVIAQLLKRWVDGKKGIIIPSYREKKGHPILIDLKYRQEIVKWSVDQTLRYFIAVYEEDWEIMETEDPNILFDINTPDDYFNLRRAKGG